MSEDVTEMIGEYRRLLVESEANRTNPSASNKLFKKKHALYKRLRETAQGREAIMSLLDDDIVPVRLSAAVHSLEWDPDRASNVLEAIEALNDGTLYSLDAKYSLKEWREGTLNLDW